MYRLGLFCTATLLVISQNLAQISFVNQADVLGFSSVISGTTYAGNGISFRDFDNDGWDDVSISTGDGIDLLFFKNINGTYVLHNFILPEMTYQTKSLSWVDIDNDGDRDLYVISNTDNGNKLFLNNGNNVFEDITSDSGLPTTNLESYSASWGDYDNDSYLDVFICNRGEGVFAPNYLFKNNGDGTFINVSAEVGIHNTSNLTFCAAFFDFNNDGWQDIYVINDKYQHSNVLYKNNGDNSFTDISIVSGTNISIDAMTSTIGDFNNDGWFDIYITNTQGGNVLLKNNGDETFSDITTLSGTSFFSVGWGAVFLDAENDTDLDLYVSGELDGSSSNYLSAAFYENLGGDIFEIPNNVGFDGDSGTSFSNAIGDVDNDGYPEIAVNNSNNEPIFLWRNLTAHSNNWLKVKLEGTISNKDGIGSLIEISVDNQNQYRYTLCNEGYLAQNSDSEFFGLGIHDEVEYIKVTWLSGIIDYYENITANQELNIIEGSNPLSTYEPEELNLTINNPVKDFLNINYSETIHEFTLYDSLGKEIYRINLSVSNPIIDLSHFQPGIYIAKFYCFNDEFIKRIIKI